MRLSNATPRCAELLYARLLLAWKSEESLAAVFSTCGRGPNFDRTAHGRAVVQKLFADSWVEAYGPGAPVPVLADRMAVIAALHPLVQGDFNLFTQVAANLSDIFLQVDTQELQKENARLQEVFAARNDVPNPFSGTKPKIKVSAATYPPDVVKDYIHAQGFIKALSILTQADFPNLSHRVTPFGRTSALADSSNFCQLPSAGDAYYKAYPTWGDVSRVFFFSPGDEATFENWNGGAFKFKDLPDEYSTFTSESGGSMLTQALSARKLAFKAWSFWVNRGATGPWAVMPRINSLQVFGPRQALQEFADSTGSAPMWETRIEQSKD